MILALPELAALAALMACSFLVALYYAYGYSLGAVLQLLAAMFRRLSINLWLVGNVGLGFVGDGIDGLDHAIRHAIGAGIEATRSGWHYFLHVSAYTLRQAGAIAEELAGDLGGAIVYVRHVVIARMIHAATHAIWARIAWLERQIAALPDHAETIIERPVKVITHRITRVEKVATSVALPRIGYLERELGGLKARLRELERLGVAGVVGVVAGTVLARLGLGWARCSNVTKVGRHLCGLDRGLLDTLLLGSTVIVSTVSLVEWAELMLELEEELAGAILGGFRETRSLA